jgi:hypothetical protein
MARRDDGGPAYPRPGYYPDTELSDFEAVRERLPSVTEPQDGMSLRDWFAGQALAGEAASHTGGQPSTADLAERAYDIADAMLVRRGL